MPLLTKTVTLNVERAPEREGVPNMLTAPSYASAFATAVDRVVANAIRARLLPLAIELRLFGFAGNERGGSELVKRVEYALPLTGIVRGFAVQILGLPDDLVQGPASQMKNVNVVGIDVQGAQDEGSSNSLAPSLLDQPTQATR